ncbi:MAG TPA: glycosyltransferase [Thermomicrobiales bacterium]|nr:glycosyltransferase [Thermomicrobiales bacterium]
MQPDRQGTKGTILITGINYAPEETGNAPYTTGLAEHLHRQGYDVTVVTGMPYYPEWSIPEAYRGRLRHQEIVNGVRVMRFRTYVPRRQDALRRIGFEAGYFLNGLTPRLPRRPDAIVGIVPSLGGAGLAAILARRYGVPYGLIFQDLVGAAATQSGMPGGRAVANATRRLEGLAARGATRIAIISRGFESYLVGLGVHKDRITHLRNWTHITAPTLPPADVRATLGWRDSETIVLHSGAMGLKQGLEHVIAAARLASATSPNMRFVLMGDGNQRQMLQAKAADLGNVTFLPPADADMFPNILAAADVLLINERASLRDMALPSKLTSYLVAGRPIVAAVTPEGWTAREIAQTGAGVVVPPEDPAALLDAIATLRADPARARLLAAAGPVYARDVLAAPVILGRAESFVQNLLGAHAHVATAPSLNLQPESQES